jgi:hypothetical protein
VQPCCNWSLVSIFKEEHGGKDTGNEENPVETGKLYETTLRSAQECATFL